MSAELLVLGGARTGESLSLGERATIGSDPSCDVRLDAPGVARVHATIVRSREGGYEVSVLGTASPVLVNGTPRTQARLYHGQKLTVGEVELQLLAARDRNPKDTSADFAVPFLPPDEPPRIERVWKSDKYKTAAFDPPQKAPDRRDSILRGLYVAGHATAERSLAKVLERTADAVATALKPDRLVIVLYERDQDRLTPTVIRRGAYDAKGGRVPVSQSVVRRSVDEGLSVVMTVHHSGEAERNIACAPLTTRTERVGAIYLEKLPGEASFSEDDVDFLGAVGRIVGLSVERVRLEAEARSRGAEQDRERSRWQAVAEALRQGVLILDAEGKIELSNPAARQILAERLGVAATATRLADLGGMKIADLVEGAKRDEPLVVEVAGAVLEVRPSPILDPDGGRSGVALLLNDVTNDRLREARFVQAEKLSTLGELLASVAHEINNPLATVLGYAELLSRKASESQKEGLEAILEEAERCRHIVSTLLSFARPRKTERADVDLGAIAGSVLDLLAHDLRSADIEVTRDLPPLPPVRADRYELQQVFFNLTRNARDAIRGTGRKGKLAVVAQTRGDRVRVEIRDSGPGFPKEAQGLLVPRPFVTTKGEKGTGLGLSIATGIVRDHGGEIHAGAAPEGGASLAVEIPASRAVVEAPADGGEAPPRAGTARRILIVDDEAHVRELLAQICREIGHDPVVACDGQEALVVVGREPQLGAVLSDLRMPNMDGVAFYHELRARSHPLASRIVFLSGDLARAETASFLKEAGRPVLAKPFRVAQVWRVLDEVLAPPGGQ
jgi:two-component system NtrC family sensor kinase